MRAYVGVIGGGRASGDVEARAAEVGRGLAEAGAVVVCGGLGGVMAAACRGAKEADGVTVGVLPGEDRSGANPWVDVALPTGLGEARNVLVVRASDALVAVGGGYGTLSEIGFALRIGRPVVGLATWTLTAAGAEGPDPGIVVVGTPEEAVAAALRAAGRAAPPRPSDA